MTEERSVYQTDGTLRNHLLGIDRMGDAAYVADCIAQNRTDILPWGVLPDTDKNRYRNIAAAVLRSLRESTEKDNIPS